jgi:hypothetical protein
MQRMKELYEERQTQYLLRRIPVIGRLDGITFSSYTAELKDKFSPEFMEVMDETGIFLAKLMQGCQLIYIQSDEISVFTDGTFTPTKIYILYMRYPQYINKEGYIMLDGTPSFNQDCELETYLEDELLDLTVQNLAMYTENQSAVQSSIYRIQTNE